MLITGSRSRLLTTSEAAALLNVSKRTIINWIQRDLVPYVRLPGGEYRLPLGALLGSISGTFDLAAELQAFDRAAATSDLDEDEAAAAVADD
jgi:excisionase family DNA binding protein